MPRIFALLLSTLLLTALSPDAAAVDRLTLDEEPQFINGRLIMPAWETRWERLARLRKDTDQQIHDYRIAHPEMYGVTTPPVQPVTFYAEFAPVDAVHYVWIPGVFDPFFMEITHELILDGSAEVIILHHGAGDRATLEAYITNHGDDPAAVTFVDVSTLGDYYVWSNPPFDNSIDSFWTVDFGPFWVEDGTGTLSIVDPRYYFGRINDDSIPHKLAGQMGVNVFRPDLGYEGGNLFSDGAGTCFATGAHVAHNAPLNEQEVNDQLFDYLGCEKMFWLQPMIAEGTGHVDMFFKNASATTLIVGEYDPLVDSENAAILDYNANLLASETNAAGEPFNVLRVPMPDNSNRWVFRSYTNGIVVNDLVLVPVYSNHAQQEAAALAVFEQAFPGTTVVGIDSEDIIEWGGAIHCVTRTRPVGTLSQMETPPTDECGGDYYCASGCGDFTQTGECVYGIPVWCTSGYINEGYCDLDERCGWDLARDAFRCVDANCGSLPAGGECRTSDDGDSVAVTCSEGGFPEGEICPTGTECALLSSDVVGCRSGCTDDCLKGEAGCDANGDPWICGEADDGDDCWEQIAEPACGADQACRDGECVCADTCSEGEGGCDADGNVWICGEAGDGDTCLEEVTFPCGSGTECRNGVCAAKDDGCGCAASGRGDLGGLLLLLALFGGFGWIRRRW